MTMMMMMIRLIILRNNLRGKIDYMNLAYMVVETGKRYIEVSSNIKSSSISLTLVQHLPEL
jgi:hypothetical protein